jgi:hypothetical protein
VFAKLVVLILVVGLGGSGLLAMRQSRLQAAHELTAARLRLRTQAELLQRLRARIAQSTAPSVLREAFEQRPELLAGLRPAVDQRGLLPAPDWAFDREAGVDAALWAHENPSDEPADGPGDQPADGAGR